MKFRKNTYVDRLVVKFYVSRRLHGINQFSVEQSISLILNKNWKLDLHTQNKFIFSFVRTYSINFKNNNERPTVYNLSVILRRNFAYFKLIKDCVKQHSTCISNGFCKAFEYIKLNEFTL